MKSNEFNYGKYGLMRLRFLKEQHPVRYASLLSSGELSGHLLDINQQAADEVDRLVDAFVKEVQMPDKNNSPEEWVKEMNALKHRAEEIICSKLIYV